MPAPRIRTMPRMPELKGLCFNHPDPEMWTPDSYSSDEGQEQVRKAQAICRICPIREACLAAAVAREGTTSKDRRTGIWGGVTPSQRYATAKREQTHRRKLAGAV